LQEPTPVLRGIVAAIVGAYLLGFVIFVTCLPKAPTNLGNIQGVVALTGGQTRIDAAYKLFRYDTVGQRLLISGVYPETSRDKLMKLLDAVDRNHPRPERDATVDRVGLIDLGYAAENTLGNAREAAAWARFYRFHTILIVTARYHMPRSLTEFRQAMPGVEIVPFPIDPESIPKDWWYDLKILRVLHGEYAKYLAAMVLSVLGLEPKDLDGEGEHGNFAG
jgi:uncharacterized SAM-binding protein YcdF (DUF218 family)